jgi:CheY-like chemotaxis protein/GGDEF domain-containing protein
VLGVSAKALADAADLPRAERYHGAGEVVMRGRLVLVVDDDPEMLELCHAVLDEAGFVVVTATNGGRALDLLDAIAPALPAVIVTDMMMPVMDGLRLLSELSRRPGRIPSVAMSGFQMYLDEARRLGAAAVLLKPLSREDLAEAVVHLSRGEPVVPSPGEKQATAAAAAAEARRLRAIADLGLGEVASEPALHGFVDSIARAFDVPMCFVSVVDESRQFWTAGCGIPDDLAVSRGSPREESFCRHAVAARSALIVQDAAENPYFRDNPFVKVRGVRFYAGVPLINREGDALGTLCLLDYQPRAFSAFDLELMTVLARRVLAEIELRERRMGVTTVPSELELAGYIDPDSRLLGREALIDVLAAELWRASARARPIALVAADAAEHLWQDVARAFRRHFEPGWVARLGPTRVAVVVPGMTSAVAREEARAVAGPETRVEAVDPSRYIGAVKTALHDLEAALA